MPRRVRWLALLTGALAASAVYLAEPDRRIMLMAHAGSSAAQFELAMSLFERDGSGTTREEAMDWLRRSARGGHRDAQAFNFVIKSASLTAIDEIEGSEEWDLLKDAADAGHPDAEELLGDYYRKKALASWEADCRRAKELSDGGSFTQRLFGCREEDDRDPTRRSDRQLMMKWYRRAAEHGSVSTQSELGHILSTSRRPLDGAPADPIEAFKWSLLAAEAGHLQSQLRVGFALRDGTGAPQDFIAAHKWLNLAAAGGLEFAAERRDEVAKHLTPEQIAIAQTQAAEWRANHDWWHPGAASPEQLSKD